MSSFGDSEPHSYSVVDSFPDGYDYGPCEDDAVSGGISSDNKPRIVLMGLRRSGKSSISKVVFHKLSPNETLFLESTSKVVKDDISNSSFVQFQIWDFPGQIDFFDPAFDSEHIFGGCGALIFVIDAQDDYRQALIRLHQTVTRAYQVNQNIKFEVFIHKVDGLSDDRKLEAQRDIHHRATDDLADAGLEGIHLSFYLTSIYDHSIFEAFSRVVQKLIPQLPTLENLLNILISNSGIEKAFLFDVVSKIYIATDSSPVDMQSYELCCDMIDVVIDVSCIYGLRDDDGCAYDQMSTSIIRLNNGTILYLREVNRVKGSLTNCPQGWYTILVLHLAQFYEQKPKYLNPDFRKERTKVYPCIATSVKAWVTQNDARFLALVCLLREDVFERQGLIEYNFHCFREAIQEVFEIRRKALLTPNTAPASDELA